MKYTIVITTLFLIYMSLTGCKTGQISEPSESTENDTSQVIIRKPNIYIYPMDTELVDLNLSFPDGGILLTSIPAYENGWHVSVTPTGKINGEYDYLFYEAQTPDRCQYEKGWSVSREYISFFFTEKLMAYGFINHEIEDFLDFWVPLLAVYPYYSIYPQSEDYINKMIRLNIEPVPDSILRLFFCVQGTPVQVTDLREPEVDPFNRTGYVLVEWGLIQK
jgi:hypothetical protein